MEHHEVGSTEWIEQLCQRARSATVPDDLSLIVGYDLGDGRSWRLGGRRGAVVCGPGLADVDVTVVTDADTARSLFTDGEIPRLLAEGRIRIRGDVRMLREGRALLAALAAATVT